MEKATWQGELPKLTNDEQREAVAPLLQKRRRRIVWSVAGFDPSSGAGITADLCTFAAFELFGCAAITALTVQTTVGVFDSQPVLSEVLEATLHRLQEDLPPEGIKVGMLGSVAAAEVLARTLERLATGSMGGSKPVVVLDPVLRSSSGRVLFPDEGLDFLHRRVLPLVDWITPNWAELAILSGVRVKSVQSAERGGELLLGRHPHLRLLVTGGDQEEPMDRLFVAGKDVVTFAGRRIETRATHGTGCAFSSALLSGLVLGKEGPQAALEAKRFVEGALLAAPGIGGGRGPMELLWPLRERAADPRLATLGE